MYACMYVCMYISIHMYMYMCVYQQVAVSKYHGPCFGSLQNWDSSILGLHFGAPCLWKLPGVVRQIPTAGACGAPHVSAFGRV